MKENWIRANVERSKRLVHTEEIFRDRVRERRGEGEMDKERFGRKDTCGKEGDIIEGGGGLPHSLSSPCLLSQWPTQEKGGQEQERILGS